MSERTLQARLEIAQMGEDHWRRSSQFYESQQQAVTRLLKEVCEIIEVPVTGSPATEADPTFYGIWRASDIMERCRSLASLASATPSATDSVQAVMADHQRWLELWAREMQKPMTMTLGRPSLTDPMQGLPMGPTLPSERPWAQRWMVLLTGLTLGWLLVRAGFRRLRTSR